MEIDDQLLKIAEKLGGLSVLVDRVDITTRDLANSQEKQRGNSEQAYSKLYDNIAETHASLKKELLEELAPLKKKIQTIEKYIWTAAGVLSVVAFFAKEVLSYVFWYAKSLIGTH